MTSEYSRELSVAIAAAKAAAAEIRARYGSVLEVRYKSPIEPVTEADVVADRLLKEQITQAFPGDAWLSEESRDGADRLSRRRVWIVDPLDGTREFIAGRPEFTVSVGLVDDGAVVVGVIVNPVTGECFAAERGHGATVDGRPLQVSSVATLAEASVAVSRSETRRGLLKDFDERVTLRPVGGMAHKLVVIARGEADATFTTRHRCEWDIAAGLLILQEAGGRVTRLDGTPFRLNQPRPMVHGVVASNGKLHDALLDLIQQVEDG